MVRNFIFTGLKHKIYNMNKSKLEYIWLDGYEPTASLRSKTKIVSDFGGTLEDCPLWSFDGSSTRQAEGNSSDCLLKPVALYPDPDRKNGFLVMTEVLNADGTPHVSNGRATIDDDDNDFWFGFEQEYFLWDPETNLPLGFPKDQTPQGQFYCSAGAKNAFGREMIEEHLEQCLEAGINVEGINAEVAPDSGNTNVFLKELKKLEIRSGFQDTCWNDWGKNTDWPSTGTPNLLDLPTGTVQGCMPTSPMKH